MTRKSATTCQRAPTAPAAAAHNHSKANVDKDVVSGINGRKSVNNEQNHDLAGDRVPDKTKVGSSKNKKKRRNLLKSSSTPSPNRAHNQATTAHTSNKSKSKKASKKDKAKIRPNQLSSSTPPQSPSLLRPLALKLSQRSKSVPTKIQTTENPPLHQQSPQRAMGLPAQSNVYSPARPLQPRKLLQSQIPRPSLVRAESERPAGRHHPSLCLPRLKDIPRICEVSVVSSLPDGSIEAVSRHIATTVEARAEQLRQLEMPFVPPAEICVRTAVITAPPPIVRCDSPPPTEIPEWLRDVCNMDSKNNENVKPRGVFSSGGAKNQVHPFQQNQNQFAPSLPSSPGTKKHSKSRRRRRWRQPAQQSLSPTQVEEHPNNDVDEFPLHSVKHHRARSNSNVERMFTELVLREASDSDDDSHSFRTPPKDDSVGSSDRAIKPKSHRRAASAGQPFKSMWQSLGGTTASPRKSPFSRLQRSATGCLA